MSVSAIVPEKSLGNKSMTKRKKKSVQISESDEIFVKVKEEEGGRMAVSLCLLNTDTDPQCNPSMFFTVQIGVCTSLVAKCLRFQCAQCDKRQAFRPTVLINNLHNGVIWWLNCIHYYHEVVGF